MTLTTPVVDPLGPEGSVVSALARNVEPFTADAIGYDTVVLNWDSPALGAWLGIMIVRSRSGFPRSYDDGIVVMQYEQPGWNEQNTFTVTDLIGGYHYFSLFLKDAFGWVRVSMRDVLIPYDYSSTDQMWDTLPEYYRVIRDDTADLSKVNLRINPALYNGTGGGEEPNLLLSAFIHLFGWGFDLLRTQAEYLTNGYDPGSVHVSRLRLLAQQFGHETESSVPAHVNRTVVRNLSSLYRKRGTLDGIHDMLTAVSGWEVEVSLGYNGLLSERQSGFTTSKVTDWDPTVKYSTGSIVRFGNYTYVGLQNNLLGYAKQPPTTATSNAFWSYAAYPRSTADIRPDTGDVGTWQVRLSTSPTTATSGLTDSVTGAPDVLGGAAQHTNALRVGHYTPGVTWLDVISVPMTYTPSKSARAAILEAGIPIPRPTKWRADRTYLAGEFVVYKGAAYEAINTSLNIPPTSTADWNRVGADDRVAFIMSSYAHGPFAGTAGTGSKTVSPKAVLYTHDGVVTQVLNNPALNTIPIFDPFVDDATTIAPSRAATSGYYPWSSDGVGTWVVDRDDNGGWAAPPATGKSQRWVVGVAPIWTTFHIAVTYTADPGTSRLVGLVFRRTDTNNYWIATQTGLYKRVAGAALANPASGATTWTKFLPGQRMRLFVDGNTINVYRNDVLIATATDAFNNTAGQPGLGAEA